ncbi:GLPGLI family protein [Fulvivirgaceae bacterium PWU4]|uniref:GLPGLI family protein n=1 Tax=Chryseosolibacter histidini TaxID=2782349 RepID=A0AAP2DTP1_9BACT|nr:GLPGLI family protein [Chryseosolibacter histidini]MBT1701143.1 GLPGLI family protein [Chryseosolibacter histidini]
MKRILILLGVLVCLAAAQVVLGQTEGHIIYEVKVNLHRTLPKEREEMKAMIPEFRTNQDQLFFNASESLYKPVEEDEDEDADMGGGGMRMRIMRPNNIIYIDQNTSRRVMEQDFMGKKYLIEDSLKIMAWKFGSETKEVKGYLCRQAMFYNEERKQNVVAWYTDKLRPFLGPEGFNTLPGAVLEVNVNDGERIISAKSITLRALKKNELKVPSDGTKITQEEFRKKVSEQMERRRAEGANVIIRN